MATEEKDKIIQIAEYFIKKSQEEPKKGLDSLKLQKLLYYSKAWGMVLNDGKKIFPDEFQAWVHGPANPKVWRYFQGFDFSAKHPEITSKIFENFTVKEREVLDMVWHSYGKHDGKYLEVLTHAEDPWLNARRGLNQTDPSQNIISDESMRAYYEQRFKEAARA